jgi:hypothetical protein
MVQVCSYVPEAFRCPDFGLVSLHICTGPCIRPTVRRTLPGMHGNGICELLA